MISKNILLVNIGEPLPIEGNKKHRMSFWFDHLTKKGHKVKFLTTNFEHQKKRWIKKKLKNYILMNSFISYHENISIGRSLNHFLISISYIKMLYKLKKPDIIICSYPTILLSLISVIYGNFFRVKVIIDVRDKWPDIFFKKKIMKIIFYILFIFKKMIFKYADEIISISSSYLDWACKSINSEKIIPLINSNYVHKKKNIKKIKFLKFVFVGSLGTTYDFKKIVSFSKNLYKNNVKHKIFICGDGPYKKKLLELIKDYNNIIFKGWLAEENLNNVLIDSHFGLLFYKKKSPQSIPNKFIEYIQFSLPIINTLGGQCNEIILKSKIGYNYNDSDISNKLGQIIKNEDNYNILKDRVNIYFKKHFNSEDSLNKLDKIIINA